MSRKRRKPQPNRLAHYGAPALFLLGVTIAVLLIRAGLQHDAVTTTTGTSTPAVVSTRPTTTTARPKQRFHVVQTGETFGTIASEEGISVEQLQSLNPEVSSNALQVGQKLRIK